MIGVVGNSNWKDYIISSYSLKSLVRHFKFEDGEFKSPVQGMLTAASATAMIIEKPEDEFCLSTLISGEISEGACRFWEERGVKVYKNVSLGIQDALEALKNGTLEEGECKKVSARQNLYDYWSSYYTWIASQDNYDEELVPYYKKGMEYYGQNLSEKDKFWLFDQSIKNDNRWFMFPHMQEFLHLTFDSKHSVNYATGFMKVFSRIDGRSCDRLEDQERMLKRIKFLADNTGKEELQVFFNEVMIVAAKNREILIAEYLMDQGADMTYESEKGESVEKYESTMDDLTMKSYLSYFRKNGKKKGLASAYFSDKGFYAPKFADEDGQVFGKRALKVCNDILKDYGKSGLLKNSTKAKDLDEFIEEYNWDDGFEVPHFIAVHPNCSQETKEKMYDLVEGGSYYGTKDFENSDDEQWKTIITELHDMLNGK